MSAWPTDLGGNQFSLCKLDPETPLRLEVRTWSSLFDEGGSVSVEGYDEHGKRHSESFASISIDSNRSVVDEREHLQLLVDDFNVDLEENWRSMVLGARASVAAFYAKQAAEYAEKAGRAAAGEFS